jgi:hypothetical protein
MFNFMGSSDVKTASAGLYKNFTPLTCVCNLRKVKAIAE